MYKIKPINHTADVAFNIEASSVNELFKAAAEATFSVMVNLKTVQPKLKKVIKLKNKKIDQLLFDFLEELIFLKDSKYMIFSKFKVNIKDSYTLEAVIQGEKINPKKQKLETDVKAITYHMFKVKKDKNWKATFILDI